MPLQTLARGVFPKQLKAFVKALDLGFGLCEMDFEEFPQLVVACGLRHLGQCLRQLLFGMQDVAQLINQQFVETHRSVRRRTLGDDRRRSARIGILKCRRRCENPIVTLVPGAARVDFALVAGAGGIVEELVYETGCRCDATDTERGLAHAFERKGKRLHVGDFPCHQELQGVLGASVVAEIDQPLIDDFGARFGRDIAAEINIEFAGYFKIIGRPGVSLRIEQIDAAAAGNGDQGIGFCCLAIEFRWLQMQACQAADDLKMAELFGADIHQKILAVWIFAVESLNRILHGSG